MSLGLGLALLASALFAALDGIRKRVVRGLSPLLAAALINGLQAAILLSASVASGDAWPEEPRFYAIALLNTGFNVTTSILYLEAVKVSPLSLTIPYLAFTPTLLIVTAAIVLGELPSLWGCAGIALVSLGAYRLQGPSDPALGWRAPIEALLRERGSRLMLLVAALWAVSSAIDKWAVGIATPTRYAGLVLALGSASMFAFILARRGAELVALDRSTVGWAALAATVGGLALTLQFTSYATLPVSYTVAIKRAGMLGSVLIGHYVYREEGALARVGPASVMVLGVVVIVALG